MKKQHSHFSRAFTLVELLVVMVILSVMLTLTAQVLQKSGSDRSMDSTVMQLESVVREARMTAIGNDTCTRIVFIDDENNRSRDSLHLRYYLIMKMEKEENVDGFYDGTNVAQRGSWKSVTRGSLLPDNIYFSPHYSGGLGWDSAANSSSMFGQDMMRVSGVGRKAVYFIEFDEKGRFVANGSSLRNPSRPLRLVLLKGTRASGRTAYNGVAPVGLDKKGRPLEAKGIVIWPTGDTSRLRTADQLETKENRPAPKRRQRKTTKS